MNKKYTAGSRRRFGPTGAASACAAVHRRGIGAALGVLMLFAAAGLAVAASPTISTFANSFIPLGAGQVTLSQPTGVAADTAGNVYVADTGNCVVWEFPSGTQKPFALAGQPGNCAGSYSSANPTLDSLNHPVDVAACNGTVYIVDTATAAIAAGPGVAAAPATSGLHAVSGGAFRNLDLGISRPGLVGVVQPQAVACDTSGDLYVQSVYNSTDQNGPSYTLDTLTAGGTTLNVGQEFNYMYQGVAVDAFGNVYTTRGAVGGLAPLTTIAKFTLASVAPNFVWDETVLTLSRYLNGPTRIALDPQGNFYVNEAAPVAAGTPLGPTVYVSEVSAAGTVFYLAGNGLPGFSGDGGAPLSAQLNNVNAIAPGAIAYVADTGNNRVRRFYSATSSLLETDPIPNFSLNTAINPVTQQLYVATNRGNDIVVYSTVNDTVAANILSAGTPTVVSYLAVDPVNNVIYASNQNGTVTVIDGATNTIDAILAVGSSPLGIAVDPALNLAYVANSSDTHISVIHGPVRTSGVITASAYTVSSENIGGILPLGAIGVDTNSHTVYAIVAGPANLGSINYTLAIINAGVLTNTVSYLNNAASSNISARALAVDQRSGLVVIADTADQSVTVYDPQTGHLQGFGQNFFPTAIALDSANEVAYASTGYGNISEINLLGGGQSIVNAPSAAAGSAQNCGLQGTAVAVDPIFAQAYFTTCDATHGAALTLWDGASSSAIATFSLGSPTVNFGTVSGAFSLAVNTASHSVYVSNSLPGKGEIDAINGPSTPAVPQLTLSLNGGAAQPLNAGASVGFGSIAVGQSSTPQTLIVTDIGAAAADVPTPVVVGGSFTNSGSTCAQGIFLSAGGGSCTTTIVFTPASNVSLSASLAFVDNERDTPQLVGLTGTGTGTHFLTVSPSSIPAAYVGLPYAPSGLPLQFTAPNASGGASFNICAAQSGPQTSPPDTSVCCPASSYSIGPQMSCPAGLLPPGINWIAPDLSATSGTLTATGSYAFSVVATDSGGDYGWTNYTLVINPMFNVLLDFSATSVTGGSSVSATVTLSEPAPVGGAFVFLNSSNTALANSTVVTVNAGLTTGIVPR